MKTHVVFVRGVNVGGRTLKMADLRACLKKLGCHNVRTVLQSGNAILESAESPAALKATIETGLSKAFGFAARVQVVGVDALREITRAYPFPADEGRHSYIVFFEDGLERALLEEADGLDPAVESIAGGAGVIYWQVPTGMTLKSPFAKYLTLARYKGSHTNRNLRTLRKVIEAAAG
ncbi:MAG TPA: DUF1697 domain-containing protein [Solirubrobacteraceae bacterium]|jgi:uncharacterized protein (DUF1697 family)